MLNILEEETGAYSVPALQRMTHIPGAEPLDPAGQCPARVLPQWQNAQRGAQTGAPQLRLAAARPAYLSLLISSRMPSVPAPTLADHASGAPYSPC